MGSNLVPLQPLFDLYEGAHNNAWRLTLGKRGERMLAVVGLNPSTATQFEADATIKRVQAVSLKHGYDGFVMLNLYPLRQTHWRKLPARANPAAIQRNTDAIRAVLQRHPVEALWAAWGNAIHARPYFIESAHFIAHVAGVMGVRWVCFGTPTASGQPRHPSRLSYEWSFQEIAIDKCLERD